MDLISSPQHGKKIFTAISGAKPRRSNVSPHAINGMPEHIHVVLSVPPKLAVAKMIGLLKGSSSHHINENYLDHTFAWQAEYGVFSFAEKSLPKIVAYVQNQKEHHAENTLVSQFEDWK